MLASETNKHYKTGYVSGSFDLFHIGHLNLLRRAKERCDKLVVSVLSDETIRARKNKWPVIPLGERVEIVKAVRYVDRVEAIDFTLIDILAARRHFGFDVFFTGDDWVNAPGADKMEQLLKEAGADQIYFPYTKERTSTAIQTVIPPPEVPQGQERVIPFQFLFPFHRVAKGERIAIYGCGTIGRQYFEQVRTLDYCPVTAFADRNCKELPAYCGMPVVDPDTLPGLAWDKVVVSVVQAGEEIREYLVSMGIDETKIVL